MRKFSDFKKIDEAVSEEQGRMMGFALMILVVALIVIFIQ